MKLTESDVVVVVEGGVVQGVFGPRSSRIIVVDWDDTPPLINIDSDPQPVTEHASLDTATRTALEGYDETR